jgi:dTMP kinase
MEMVHITELLLYSAARAQLVHEKIIPSLELYDVVISDRYADSSIAYQGYGRGISVKFIRSLNSVTTSNRIPFVTYILDISPELSIKRIGKLPVRDRLESENLNFMSKVRTGYSKIASMEPERCVVIPGERSIAEISDVIWDDFSRRFKPKNFFKKGV